MRGQGVGIGPNVFPAFDAATILEVVQNDTAGIRVMQQGVTLEEFRMTSSGTRAAAAFSVSKPGIRWEPADASSARADKGIVRRVRVGEQPGDCLVTVGEVTGFETHMFEAVFSRGMGIRHEAGNYTGFTRTNVLYPGLITHYAPRMGFLGGHALSISNPSATAQNHMGIRIVTEQLDCYGCANDAAVRFTNDAIYVFGENCEVNHSGIGGSGWTGSALVDEMGGGIYIAGRDNKLENNRYIYTNQPVTFGYRASQPSTGLDIYKLRNVNSTPVTNFCEAAPGTAGLRITYDRIEGFTNIVNPDADNVVEHFLGTIRLRGGRHRAGTYTSSRTLPIADDGVATIQITNISTPAASGVITISATSPAAGGGQFHVRVGSSPTAVKWSGNDNTTAGPSGGAGALSGTTGTDGNLNVSCDADRIYIENRRGFAVSVEVHVACLTPTAKLLPSQ